MSLLLQDEKALDGLIVELACAEQLLIAVDFDGTIAELAPTPGGASLDDDAARALQALAGTANTSVAIVSGRELGDLKRLAGHLNGVRLIGSHGGEFDGESDDPPPVSSPELINELVTKLRSLEESFPGLCIERKRHGIAVHYRACPQDQHQIIQHQTRGLFSLVPRGVMRAGKCVLEFSLLETNKGIALRKLCSELGPSITLFLGDDETDEDGFLALPEGGVSIKVGPGATIAKYRLKNEAQARKFLLALVKARAERLCTEFSPPIRSLAFVSDLRTGALIDESGSVVWMSIPAFDGPPVFGSLLGGGAAGFFRIRLPGVTQRVYGEEDLILTSSSSGLTLVDFLDSAGGRPYQRAGRTDLVRLLSGEGEVAIEFVPRLSFGAVPTRLSQHAGGLRVQLGSHMAALRSPEVDWTISRVGNHDVAKGALRLSGGNACFEFRVGTGSLEPATLEIPDRLRATRQFWAAWLRSLSFPEYSRASVSRSALVLRGLTFGPTGAMLAAATTSLPEVEGGTRNWDYRFCWIRDAAFAASALVRLGSTGTAMRLLDWLAGVLEAGGSGTFLSPLYTVRGGAVPHEAEVAGVPGYANSRPVRIGNLAASQLQLDVIGPVASLLASLADAGAALGESHAWLAGEFLRLISERWMSPDSGIWEMRTEPRHYVHSKIMCWVAVRDARRVLRYLGEGGGGEWEVLEQQIRTEIEERGYFPSVESYVAAYDNAAPDAALLWVVLSGFHDPLHKRAIGTVEYVRRHLLRNGGVYRYHYEDALPGTEGHFHLCTAWLIEALAMQGRTEEARELFTALENAGSSLGLFSEEWSPEQGKALGNVPQLYSHLGIINAACAIAGR